MHIPLEAAVPAAQPAPDATVTEPRTRKRWFRRKRVMIPLTALVVALGIAGFLGWRVSQAFDTINGVSTPPPAVSGAALGGDSGVTVDTGPAVAAVQTYEAEQRQAAATDPTEPANQIALATTPTPTDDVLAEPTQPADITAEPTVEAIAGDTGPARGTVAPAGGDLPDAPAGPTEDALDARATIEPTRAPVEPTAAPAEPTSAPQDPTQAPVTEAPVIEPTPSPTTAPPTGEDAVTILLMGVDARDGEAIDVGVRPDALAVLHLDPATGSCRMLQVPRDTRVDLPGYGLSKVNHALAVGSVPYQMQVVEQYLGIELDHYGLIDFGGVVAIVDKVGGVEVDNPAAFSAAGFDFPAGPQTLNGEQALAYARFRGDAEGDFGRIGRQQEVLRAVMETVAPGDLVGMIPDMLPLLEDHTRTDLSPGDLTDLGQTYGTTCTADSIETYTLQGGTATYYDPLIQLNLSYVVIDEDERARGREWLLTGDMP